MLFFQNYSNLYPPNKTLCAQNINSEIEIRKEIYKNSLWNKYNKNDDSWINYKGNAVTNKYNRFK
ncbi:hypothetical protein [Spiroplasma endosymbiont of Tipula paludosa]|uniref:hypothetical protein n=1 Tax=Spiroplasma endosymbiont of Tipula paludosa TaxID=3066295 RepID=UPI0035C8DEFE